MEAKNRFYESLPTELKLSSTLIANFDNISENLKAFFEANIEYPKYIKSMFEGIQELANNPPVVFTTYHDIDSKKDKGLSKITEEVNPGSIAILPKDLPDLTENEVKLANEISKNILKDIVAPVVEVGFKYAILEHQLKLQTDNIDVFKKEGVATTNPTNMIGVLTSRIFTLAKEKSYKTDYMQGNQFDPDQERQYHDLGIFKKEVKDQFFQLNKRHKIAISRHAVDLTGMHRELKSWKGKSRIVNL